MRKNVLMISVTLTEGKKTRDYGFAIYKSSPLSRMIPDNLELPVIGRVRLNSTELDSLFLVDGNFTVKNFDRFIDEMGKVGWCFYYIGDPRTSIDVDEETENMLRGAEANCELNCRTRMGHFTSTDGRYFIAPTFDIDGFFVYDKEGQRARLVPSYAQVQRLIG